MDKQNLNIADIYKKHYEKWKKNSICLNMKRYESEGGFHFLLSGCIHVLNNENYNMFFRNIPCFGSPGFWPKTKNCEIIINCRYTYHCFKMVIKTLEKGIYEWEKQYYETIFNNLSLEHEIEIKAIIDVLKKEISFMKNRLIFKKWWFLRGFKIAKS